MRSRRAAVKAQRRTFMLGLMVLTVIVIGSVLLGTIRTQAAPAEPSYKYYTSIQIQKGDTLWNIADEYITDDYDSMDKYMEEICAINHILPGDIHSGQYLTIPYYSADTRKYIDQGHHKRRKNPHCAGGAEPVRRGMRFLQWLRQSGRRIGGRFLRTVHQWRKGIAGTERGVSQQLRPGSLGGGDETAGGSLFHGGGEKRIYKRDVSVYCRLQYVRALCGF